MCETATSVEGGESAHEQLMKNREEYQKLFTGMVNTGGDSAEILGVSPKYL